MKYTECNGSTHRTNFSIRYSTTTVMYGTSSAPYLTTCCLNRCAEEGAERYAVAAAVVNNIFYVVDMLAGFQTIEEGKLVCKDIRELLQGSGFNMRKWNSNHPEILSKIPPKLHDDRKF